ncbi:MAG: DoxX family protein [Opitutae bacterium]|nr:DoxX family protein [Kiritimatiellia bacterium]NCC92168.1 DoxX family protein [Opitutae bacterium]
MIRARPLFIWLARIAVAAVFLGACIAKIRDPEAFALATHRYRLLPGELVNAVAILLPWLELTCGVALLAGPRRARAAAAFLLAGMLLVFTGAISLNLLRGIEASCGCFTTRADAAVSDGWNLLRNGALIWLSAMIFLNAWRAPARSKTS